jgi:GTP-binding protein Era
VQETFMVSALSGDGVEDLKNAVLKRLPDGPWLYPEDQISDLPSRMLAAEATREKLFIQLHQELPYNLTVETELFEVQKNGDLKINQVIYVSRDSHKAMVLGKGGARIKQIGSQSRQDLGELFDRKVHLFLFVKVRENWLNDPERFREMGLELG